MHSSRHSLPGRHWVASAVLRAAAVAGCVLALAACNTARYDANASIPFDYRERHPIVIKEGDRTVELFVGRSRGGLSPAQRADVFHFAQVWRREATGGVAVDLPAGTPNARAAADALREIKSILTATGVPPRGIVVRPYHPADPAQLATVKLSYSKIVAEAGPCGLWPQDIGPSLNRGYFENRQYWNLGCANQRNLAAMVDNPADLVQPRGETPPMAGRRSTVLDKFRKGESTATTYPDANRGRISDIGQ
jgi:pilus assembly protein CpaD